MAETESTSWPDRWNHVSKLLERTGPFAHPDFEPGAQVGITHSLFDRMDHIRI